MINVGFAYKRLNIQTDENCFFIDRESTDEYHGIRWRKFAPNYTSDIPIQIIGTPYTTTRISNILEFLCSTTPTWHNIINGRNSDTITIDSKLTNLLSIVENIKNTSIKRKRAVSVIYKLMFLSVWFFNVISNHPDWLDILIDMNKSSIDYYLYDNRKETMNIDKNLSSVFIWGMPEVIKFFVSLV